MKSVLKNLQSIYLKYLQDENLPLPRIIHVETRSRCNSSCSFCPASVSNDKREDIYMPMELIKKIVYELKELDYFNRLSFYNNNEPFIDKRIYDIIKFAREKLPKSFLELKTNGKVLNLERILEIFNAGLDMLYINDYVKNSGYRQNIQEIITDLKNIRRFKGHFDYDHYYSRIEISLQNINDVKGSRAGTAPNKPFPVKIFYKSCYRPFEMMTIDPIGRVSVCSEDFHYNILMGNINKQSIYEIWTSHKWNELRKKLLNGNRSSTETCSKCDYKGFSYEMLNEQGLLQKRNPGLTIKKVVKKIIYLISYPITKMK